MSVGDLITVPVLGVDDIDTLMRTAEKHKTVKGTDMNARSSRSHTVFQLRIRACRELKGRPKELLHGSLNLVDLAGSERLDKSGATGDRLKETQVSLSLSGFLSLSLGFSLSLRVSLTQVSLCFNPWLKEKAFSLVLLLLDPGFSLRPSFISLSLLYILVELTDTLECRLSTSPCQLSATSSQPSPRSSRTCPTATRLSPAFSSPVSGRLLSQSACG